MLHTMTLPYKIYITDLRPLRMPYDILQIYVNIIDRKSIQTKGHSSFYLYYNLCEYKPNLE